MADALAPVVLEGAHVRLEPLTLAHVGALCRAAAGPRDTYAFTTVPVTEEAMRAYVEAALAEQAARRALPFATVNSSGTVVGSTRFGNIDSGRGRPATRTSAARRCRTWSRSAGRG
jgi:N-acetyltransferase